jgi:hypothetical protein
VGAQAAYAFSYRAVSDLAARDTARGLTLFFRYWGETRSLDQAVRPCMTTRRDSGKATAAPHSGASGPTHARKWATSGASAMRTRCRGRGSQGKLSFRAAEATRERASASSRG